MSGISPNAAPGELELVRRFVNTHDLEERREELADPDGVRAWLLENGLAARGLHVDEQEAGRVRALREALRKLLLANNGAPLDSGAVRECRAAGERARLAVDFDSEGRAQLASAEGGVDGALGRILAAVATAMADDTWPRLKACPDDDCQWAFYDHSKNRSARWCKMSVCGNRAKARAYRERHRTSGS